MIPETFTTTPLPTTSFETPREAQELYVGAMRLEIPGFVIRQASHDPDIVSERLATILRPVVRMGKQQDNFSFQHEIGKGIGLHIDSHMPQDPHQPQINTHVVRECSHEVDVTLFSLRPHYRAQLSDRTAQPPTLNIGKADRILFESGQVDSSRLVPTAHNAQLIRGDALVFTDSQHAHDFAPVAGPRRSEALIFFPRLTTYGRIALRLRKL